MKTFRGAKYKSSYLAFSIFLLKNESQLGFSEIADSYGLEIEKTMRLYKCAVQVFNLSNISDNNLGGR